MAEIKKDWWQSSNFWTAAIMVVAGAFTGFTEEMAQTAVGAVFGIIAVGKTLHNYFKSAEIDFKAWVLNSNFVNYAMVIISTFTAVIKPELLQKIQQLAGGLIDGDIGAALAAAFSVLTIIWNLFQSPRKPA